MVASYLAKQQLTAPTAHESKLGSWDLWRSLPRPCKLFLVVCVIQAVTAGAFASRQLAKVRLQSSWCSKKNVISSTRV
jgi:hypothetical protein